MKNEIEICAYYLWEKSKKINGNDDPVANWLIAEKHIQKLKSRITLEDKYDSLKKLGYSAIGCGGVWWNGVDYLQICFYGNKTSIKSISQENYFELLKK